MTPETRNALTASLERLREAGLSVERASEPWLRLYQVNGLGELTEGQIIDLAHAYEASRYGGALPWTIGIDR